MSLLSYKLLRRFSNLRHTASDQNKANQVQIGYRSVPENLRRPCLELFAHPENGVAIEAKQSFPEWQAHSSDRSPKPDQMLQLLRYIAHLSNTTNQVRFGCWRFWSSP